jgi:lysophospholipase L1-like esterase
MTKNRERLAVRIVMSKKRTNIPLMPIAIVLVAILVFAVIGAVSSAFEKKEEVEDVTAAGIAYLEAREKKDPGSVMQARQDIYQAKINAQRTQLINQLTNGTMDPFSLFKDYVLMGDSRAVGFWYRDFLEKSRVLADGGHTIRNLKEQIDTLVEKNPSLIFLCYGLNDTSIGYWGSAQEYVTEYMQTVKEIRDKLPNATIVVSSILPAKDPAFEKSAKWRNIPEWSAALEKACKDNGILFANCDQLAVDHPNLWDPDGIHFRKEFYPYWASCLAATLLMEGVE